MRRRLYYPLILVVLLATTALGSSYSYNTFDLVDEVTHDGLFRDVEKALLSNEANPLKLRRAFYYSPTAAPVLLKVVYNISFGNNLTNASDLSDLTSCDTRPNEDSQTLTDSEPQEVTYGWTSSGVYTLFHPLVLSAIQALIPFAAMRIVHLTVNRRSPEADTFLWDGSYELPTLPLDIHFTSLSCIPSQEQLEFVLSDINTLLKIYAGQQNTFKFLPEHHMIGFTLPSISVSKTITPSQSDLTLVNLYSASLCFTYGVGMVLFIVLYYKNTVYEETISKHLKQNEDIYAGLLITTVTALAIEMVTRFVQCMVWTAYIDNFLGTFLTVWLPQGDIFFMATFINICGHIFTYIHEYCRERPKRSDIIWTIHLSSMHAVLPLALITFGLLYTLIPAVILIFAYPTQMIAILACILSFLFATTIFSAILYKCFIYISQAEPQKGRKIVIFLSIFVPFLILIIYIHCIAIVLLYLLIIGRGSVITTGPIFVVSLLPPIFLSSITWIAKQYFLSKKSEDTKNIVTSTNGDTQDSTHAAVLDNDL